MKEADKILFKRERTGLIISLSIRLLSMITLSLGHLVAHHTILELYRVVTLSIVFIFINFISIYLVYKNRFFKTIGLLGVFLDFILLIYLPYNWYDSVGSYDKVPSVYLFKTSLPIFAVLLISISSLAIRPLYPIIEGLLFNLIWFGFYQIIINDPRTIFTDSFLENFFTEKILINYYIFTFPMSVLGIALFMGLLTYSYRSSIIQAVKLEIETNQISRYFSPSILNEIRNNEDLFESKKVKAVVMFLDIRSFTSMTENMDPTTVIQFLRKFHSGVVNIIYEEEGTIDKFLGDGIMVTFGTPSEKVDDCFRAIRCILKIRFFLKDFNNSRKKENLNQIQIGLGLHYGEVVVGNLGSEERLEYTVIGDTVNLASRLEGLCKDHDVDCIISSDLVENVSKIRNDFSFRKIGEVQVRGKSNFVTIFTLDL
jgi:adenylate cyclase